MQDVVVRGQELVTLYGLNVIGAIVIFVVGRWGARLARHLLDALLTGKDVDPTLRGFASHLTYIVLLIFVVIAALSRLGIQTASFIVVLGAAGLAIGLALQGALANFAAGLLLIVFKPFKVGDYIEGAGTAGTVEEIQLFTTRLATPDNRTVIIPNARLSSDNIINYSAKPVRRLDMMFSVGYSEDIDKVKKVIAEVLAADERILPEPTPQIAVSELADSSVRLVVRPWVNAADHWPVWFDIHEAIKKRFDAEGIAIPFPQRDIHIHEHRA